MKKKIEEEMDEEKIKEDAKKKQNKQLKIILAIGIIIFLGVVATFWIIQESKKFTYAGLAFEKIKYGNLEVYHAKIPISGITGDVIANYNMYLRNDPRDLKNISVDGDIRLTKRSILSLSPEIEKCGDGGIAGMNLGMFFNAAGIKVDFATTNMERASERNETFADCSVESNLSIIVIKNGENTEIKKDGKDCYVVYAANCEILKATERFMIATMANSKGIEV